MPLLRRRACPFATDPEEEFYRDLRDGRFDRTEPRPQSPRHDSPEALDQHEPTRCLSCGYLLTSQHIGCPRCASGH